MNSNRYLHKIIFIIHNMSDLKICNVQLSDSDFMTKGSNKQ
jgi:hypothetical protein